MMRLLLEDWQHRYQMQVCVVFFIQEVSKGYQVVDLHERYISTVRLSFHLWKTKLLL